MRCRSSASASDQRHHLTRDWAEGLSDPRQKERVQHESAQRQQTGITGDLAAGKIGVDGLMTVEGEVQL